MQSPPNLTDKSALTRNRARALAMDEPAMFLQQDAALEVQERLQLVNRTFTKPAIVTPFPDIWRPVAPEALLIRDDDVLDLRENTHDLVVHGMGLHWANDPVGQLIQCQRALQPDGLLMVAMLGGQTLHELRAVLAEAEIAQTGGLSPRVVPMADIRDLGALLQRAGLALPVADSFVRNVTYQSPLHLMRDLRAMGETNAMAQRSRQPMSRKLLMDANARYLSAFGQDGRISATFELIFLTGWAPDASQPQPLRPGSAVNRLADALGTQETTVSDPAKPGRV